MSQDLPPVPHTVSIADVYGRVSPVWSDWFKKIFARVGGHIASSITELEARFPIVTVDITDDAVTSAKLKDDASTDANRAVTTNHIRDLAITTGKLNDLSVTTGKINDLAVTTGKILDGAVSFSKMLSSDWTSSKVTTGYQKLPSGIIVQWGLTNSIASATNTVVSFPTTFPNACLNVTANPAGNSAGSTLDSGHWGTGSFTTTTFTMLNRTTASYAFFWHAIGY